MATTSLRSHFFEEMANDNLIFADIERVIATGRVQRRFTRDPRGARYENCWNHHRRAGGRSHLSNQRDWQAAFHNHICFGINMNNNKKKYNYGKCHVCGEQMQEKKI